MPRACAGGCTPRCVTAKRKCASRLTGRWRNCRCRWGARYLRHLLDLYGGQLELALAAYNAGEGAVRRAGQKIPPFRETQNYVKTVLALYRQLQPLAPVGATPRAEAGARSSRIRMTLPGSASGTFDEKREP